MSVRFRNTPVASRRAFFFLRDADAQYDGLQLELRTKDVHDKVRLVYMVQRLVNLGACYRGTFQTVMYTQKRLNEGSTFEQAMQEVWENDVRDRQDRLWLLLHDVSWCARLAIKLRGVETYTEALGRVVMPEHIGYEGQDWYVALVAASVGRKFTYATLAQDLVTNLTGTALSDALQWTNCDDAVHRLLQQ